MAALARDGNGIPLNSMAGQPLAVTYDATISSSTAINLNANTTIVEVVATGQPVLCKWGATASTSAWDAVVAPGTVRHLKRPPNVATLNVIEAAASAAVGVAEY